MIDVSYLVFCSVLVMVVAVFHTTLNEDDDYA